MLVAGFVALAAVTGEPRYDAVGSIAIGCVLIVVSIFVGVPVKSLLVGRSAEPDLVAAIEAHIADDPDVHEVYNVLTVQMGPDVVLAAKLHLREDLTAREGCERINALERALKERFPEIRWCFVEPDVHD